MDYFKYFPKVEYSGNLVTNIMLRAKVRDAVLRNTVVYYPYTITDSDRPDIMSHKYYGSSKFTWLIFYANNIIDPHYDWPLSDRNLENFIIGKYGSVLSANQTHHHYENNRGLIIDLTTYLAEGGSDISCYEWELYKNESKREIKIIDSRYKSQIINELKDIFR